MKKSLRDLQSRIKHLDAELGRLRELRHHDMECWHTERQQLKQEIADKGLVEIRQIIANWGQSNEAFARAISAIRGY